MKPKKHIIFGILALVFLCKEPLYAFDLLMNTSTRSEYDADGKLALKSKYSHGFMGGGTTLWAEDGTLADDWRFTQGFQYTLPPPLQPELHEARWANNPLGPEPVPSTAIPYSSGFRYPVDGTRKCYYAGGRPGAQP